jgi:hypothetical protein
MDKAGMAKDTRKRVLEPSYENTRAGGHACRRKLPRIIELLRSGCLTHDAFNSYSAEMEQGVKMCVSRRNDNACQRRMPS